ncbi:MAG: hypothetical protein KIT72_08530 [Polyangiaceae bacterium]|nr:hypothetical protein [Polyangiaceae bacterium]MCW5790453.1 hypothetical protein [Polyangiaceae bacterium]
MKVREERILADRKLAKNGGQIDELLEPAGRKPSTQGLALDDGAKLDLGRVLQGDRFFALLMVRALTYDPEYALGCSCRNDNCRARIEWEIDLTKLPVRALSEESRAAFERRGWRCVRRRISRSVHTRGRVRRLTVRRISSRRWVGRVGVT